MAKTIFWVVTWKLPSIFVSKTMEMAIIQNSVRFFCISRYSFIHANCCTNSAANVEIGACNVLIIFAFVVSLYH